MILKKIKDLPQVEKTIEKIYIEKDGIIKKILIVFMKIPMTNLSPEYNEEKAGEVIKLAVEFVSQNDSYDRVEFEQN